jgi:hypothetical protein
MSASFFVIFDPPCKTRSPASPVDFGIGNSALDRFSRLYGLGSSRSGSGQTAGTRTRAATPRVDKIAGGGHAATCQLGSWT